jgi:hypothetical protein
MAESGVLITDDNEAASTKHDEAPPSPDETIGSIDSGSASDATASKQVREKLECGNGDDGAIGEPHTDEIAGWTESDTVTNGKV